MVLLVSVWSRFSIKMIKIKPNLIEIRDLIGNGRLYYNSLNWLLKLASVAPPINKHMLTLQIRIVLKNWILPCSNARGLR
jgi:hypothetical protein